MLYDRPKKAEMRYQLRDYRITPGAITEFVSEWRGGVLRLQSQAGFEIVGAWSNPESNRFVWVVAHQGDFEEADRLYYESPERSRLSPDPARLIEEAHAEFVTPAIEPHEREPGVHTVGRPTTHADVPICSVWQCDRYRS